MHRYQAMVEGMDIAIGRTLQGLEQLGLADNTLVVFTSDNGHLAGYTSAAPLRASKGYLYEGGIRVPLIVRWPGKIKAGSMNATPVLTIDYTPTFLEAAGIEFKETDYDGRSLLDELTGSRALEREAIYFHYPHYAWHRSNDMGSIVRKGNMKLLHFYERDAYELYDLKADIGEQKNLIDDKPELAKQMKTLLAAWRQDTGAEKPRLKADIPADELRGKKTP